jgi:hypothetical protein
MDVEEDPAGRALLPAGLLRQAAKGDGEQRAALVKTDAGDEPPGERQRNHWIFNDLADTIEGKADLRLAHTASDPCHCRNVRRAFRLIGHASGPPRL